jgi:predicted PurR-regulated permease PerM
MLPPFVFAGLLAYIATPAIDWATARTRLPRPIFVFLVFALFLLLATLVAYLGIPPLAREMTMFLMTSRLSSASWRNA